MLNLLFCIENFGARAIAYITGPNRYRKIEDRKKTNMSNMKVQLRHLKKVMTKQLNNLANIEFTSIQV